MFLKGLSDRNSHGIFNGGDSFRGKVFKLYYEGSTRPGPRFDRQA